MSLKLYLAHPFPTRRRMREWELRTERRTGIELLNPFYDTDREDIKLIDSGTIDRSQYVNILNPTDIVEGDVNLIESSDGIVVYIDGSMSVGVYMEVVYAFKANIPIYIIWEAKSIRNHPWLIYHATQTFNSLTSFTRWLGKQAKKGKKHARN